VFGGFIIDSDFHGVLRGVQSKAAAERGVHTCMHACMHARKGFTCTTAPASVAYTADVTISPKDCAVSAQIVVQN
jgi:hypothetical protein